MRPGEYSYRSPIWPVQDESLADDDRVIPILKTFYSSSTLVRTGGQDDVDGQAAPTSRYPVTQAG